MTTFRSAAINTEIHKKFLLTGVITDDTIRRSFEIEAEFPLSPRRKWAHAGSYFRLNKLFVPKLQWIALQAVHFFIRRFDKYDRTFSFLKMTLRRCDIDNLINEQIREKEVRLIGESGEQLGVVPIAEARARAEEAGVDLVLIAPKAAPPVCKLIDYGKFRYEQ